MGEMRMKCSSCGSENVNDMVVTFLWENEVLDTTTLPKFLYYLRYPKDRHKGYYEPDLKVIEVKEVYCHSCIDKGKTEIKPTRFGI